MLFLYESLLQVVKIHFQNYLNNSIAGILFAQFDLNALGIRLFSVVAYILE